MLDICKPRDAKKRVIVNVGIEGRGVSSNSATLDAIDRVTDVCAGGKLGGGVDDVYSNISGFNRSSCGSSENKRGVV